MQRVLCYILGIQKVNRRLSQIRVAGAVLNAYKIKKQWLVLSECLAALCTGHVLTHLDSSMTL